MPNYRIKCLDYEGDTGTVFEAPSFGFAVDFYLATHGMFGYNSLTCEKTQDGPDEPLSELLKYYPKAMEETEQKRLDEWHQNVEHIN